MSFLVLILSLIFFFGTENCAATNSTIKQYPFMVSIHDFSSGDYICSASVIASRWILTAAHCLTNRTANQTIIQYGTQILGTYIPNNATVNKIIPHEGFNSSQGNQNDIGLIQITNFFIYNYTTCVPVTLPAQSYEINQNVASVPGVLAGWGINVTTGVLQQRLQAMNLTIYSNVNCPTLYPGINTNISICAGNSSQKHDACIGGPLLYMGSLQVGILSSSCPSENPIHIYTKVSNYISWINMQILENS